MTRPLPAVLVLLASWLPGWPLHAVMQHADLLLVLVHVLVTMLGLELELELEPGQLELVLELAQLELVLEPPEQGQQVQNKLKHKDNDTKAHSGCPHIMYYGVSGLDLLIPINREHLITVQTRVLVAQFFHQDPTEHLGSHNCK